ncbi:MAG: ATP-binding protein [Bifidobacterium tibiigranuli]|jgi:two-component system sensor histidine kinase SenX3|uniref:sensor histidine kinase n=1 Tax=Bifidobacterium tibiigranuli TaxID=2172043 RepID=UPI0023548707|nr:ATP-binding protein [Bifidobacterium tibiigranuli]MCH3975297.1 ATP-binding protein [Bifidobacterium tibiigranuli]MCH4203496.1 ATP-binding protein [Bifidobacterium tibiigranuli]MCH4273892.1 ATP-binding protein [Bifidobacterium tibiigranuli]MCI1791132.1 ATP-binding protein [Bifidobacterium tibiigranuli]MCI1798445.1 ATP-binding protein [Bifidobacterium tibiigranuli]
MLAGITVAQFLVLAALIVVVATIALTWLVVSVRDRNSERADDAPWSPGQRLFDDESLSPHVVHRMIEAMPNALIVCSSQGLVSYLSPGAAQLGLVDRDRLAAPELMDLLAQVDSDGVLRERELTTGAGEQATHTRVRIGAIDDDAYAVFLDDVSEQRRFEEVRRDFVTNVSHELKTPSGAIALLAETISDAADDPDAVRYFAGRITKESERLNQLVRHLIDLQRVQDMSAMQATQRVDALAAVREAIELNATSAQERQIDVRLTVDGQMHQMPQMHPSASSDSRFEVLADRESLTTAVRNLVENAIRYSPQHGSVVVVLERAGDTAPIDAASTHAVPTHAVRIRVVDQGIGIPKDAQARVFERFYRVDAARSRATGGSGLGLSIAKHGIEEHGGSLSMWSHEGFGSTFTIELPAAPENTEA